MKRKHKSEYKTAELTIANAIESINKMSNETAWEVIDTMQRMLKTTLMLGQPGNYVLNVKEFLNTDRLMKKHKKLFMLLSTNEPDLYAVIHLLAIKGAVVYIGENSLKLVRDTVWIPGYGTFKFTNPKDRELDIELIPDEG